MKIVFLTNYLTHHQVEFCDILYNKTKGYFWLVSTRDVDQEQKKLGYRDLNSEYPYVLKLYESEEIRKKVLLLCMEADVVILGAAPLHFIKERIKADKLTFIYTERIFKKGYIYALHPNSIRFMLRKYTVNRKKQQFYLCSSAYTASDINWYTHTPEKFFKWGYFPPRNEYRSFEEILPQKKNDVIEIVWAGRFIDWKHPEYVIQAAEILHHKGYKFHISMIGNGVCWENIQNSVTHELKEKIDFSFAVSPEEVRRIMEHANIYLATSDFNEGWGAVVNEAMNSGCAVVASHAMGAVPFLIKNNENGLIYRSGDVDNLSNAIQKLLDDCHLMEKLGKNAFNTIISEWNARVATERFYSLCQGLLLDKIAVTYKDGPCSVAPIIKNDWLKG